MQSAVGGGIAHGEVKLQTGAGGGLRLAGRLQPRNIDIASALQAFSRRSMVSGKASGDTTQSASGDSVGQIVWSLHTTTRFNVGPAALLPGVGTALGARIGSVIGKLLGSQPEGKRRLAPVEK